MSTTELVALLALTGWAVYKQTRATEVTDKGRFKMAYIYAAIGLAVGGFAVPHGVAAYTLLIASLALSAVVGQIRGRVTTLWRDGQGQVWQRGNIASVSLFLALVASKFLLGTVAYVAHVHDGAGFGEILVMIAIMIAVQAEIIRRRATTLAAAPPTPVLARI